MAHLAAAAAEAVGHAQAGVACKFGHVGLAGQNGACAAQRRSDGRVPCDEIVGQRKAAARGVQAGCVDAVLKQDGQAEQRQRAQLPPAVEPDCLLVYILAQLSHGVQPVRSVVEARNARQVMLRQFQHAELSASQQLEQAAHGEKR